LCCVTWTADKPLSAAVRQDRHAWPSNACSATLAIVATVFDAGDPTEFGWRLEYFREGVTVARIVGRDGDGNEHERQTSEEVKALILRAWVTRHPRMQLVSFETS
jgi:hypothetical protein